MAAVRNGFLGGELLATIGGGRRLELNAAASWLRVCADVQRRFGWTPTLSDGVTAYRSMAEQERIFRENYSTAFSEGDRVHRLVWNGVTWWRRPGKASAAIPGTSNHGWGLAVDVARLGGFDGERYAQFCLVAREHGWTNTQGRSIGEYWHHVYSAAGDRHAGTTVPPVTPPIAVPLEEDDMKLIRINEDGRIIAVTPTTFTVVPDVPHYNALALIYGTYVPVSVVEADRIHDQVKANVKAVWGATIGQVGGQERTVGQGVQLAAKAAVGDKSV